MRVALKPWVLVSAVLGGAGCLVAETGGTASPCAVNTDCPSTHRCVTVSAEAGVCELIYPPPDTSAGNSDAGTPDAGPAPTWCDDIQPLMAKNCVSSCHGEVTTGSGKTDFRLDRYETVGAVAGAKDKADRIKFRGVDQRSMPPAPPYFSAAEQSLVLRWIAAGTPECSDDGGTP
ncbi:hypothetical protein [Melittangium boletus]|uniref:Lipoprotein n=1 Tax=Melittangium boletus DSM 14713 TaxID=1294270 RepID=A0A250ISU2_9BACT|nr:hypothetical protein [Melittangium boletus]ATB34247.1 hypothetical protein MEBOL_007748 [Melittangium boletus DSM 14713]